MNKADKSGKKSGSGRAKKSGKSAGKKGGRVTAERKKTTRPALFSDHAYFAVPLQPSVLHIGGIG